MRDPKVTKQRPEGIIALCPLIFCNSYMPVLLKSGFFRSFFSALCSGLLSCCSQLDSLQHLSSATAANVSWFFGQLFMKLTYRLCRKRNFPPISSLLVLVTFCNTWLQLAPFVFIFPRSVFTAFCPCWGQSSLHPVTYFLLQFLTWFFMWIFYSLWTNMALAFCGTFIR